MSAELGVFDLASGEHRVTVGGHGEGPGEFQTPDLIDFDLDGSAWIWDQSQARLTVPGADGRVSDVHSLGQGHELPPRVLHRTGRGSFVAQLPRRFGGALHEGMILRDTTTLWELDAPDAEPRVVARYPNQFSYFLQGTQRALPFAGTRHRLWARVKGSYAANTFPFPGS